MVPALQRPVVEHIYFVSNVRRADSDRIGRWPVIGHRCLKCPDLEHLQHRRQRRALARDADVTRFAKAGVRERKIAETAHAPGARSALKIAMPNSRLHDDRSMQKERVPFCIIADAPTWRTACREG